LRVLQSELKFNICHLLSSYLRNINIPDIEWRIQTYISGQLQYACRFWADHLTAISYDSSSAQAAGTFLLDQFLFWLEVMSLLGMVGHAQQALSKFILWAEEVCRFVLILSLGSMRIFFRNHPLFNLPEMQRDLLLSLQMQSIRVLPISTFQHCHWPQQSPKLPKDFDLSSLL
jgi:hypothetical protein